MEEYRRRMAEKYRCLSEDEKPRIKICHDCQRPEHETAVCLETGLFHPKSYAKETRTVCGVRMDSEDRIITGDRFTRLLSKIRITWQPARVRVVKLHEDSTNIFSTFAMSRAWKMQRLGFMYGKVIEECSTEHGSLSTVVEVHTVYEPEQESQTDDVILEKDPRQSRVDRLASFFGLQRVGIMLSHAARDDENLILRAKELLLCMKEQSRWGDHCTIVTVAPNPESNETTVEAWQASEQAVHLFREGYLSELTSAATRNDASAMLGMIHSQIPLEVAEVKSAENAMSGSYRAPLLVCKQPSQDVDARWMTAPVAVAGFTGAVIESRFVRLTRPGEIPPTMENLKNYYKDPKRANQTFLERMRDFHVLIFLMENLLDFDTELTVLIQNILIGDEEGAEGHRLLIEASWD